jgi:hypothetical protein
MNSERWSRLKALFQGALDRPAEARAAWLREVCGPDESLLREAEALLRAHEADDHFLEQPPQFDPADLETFPDGMALGSYRIVREIGRGGMGVVYLAYDTRLERDVALKALPPLLASDTELRRRLRREANAAARIKHEAVATVHSLEEIDEHLVIVSEYVEGETLRAVLSHGAIERSRAYSLALEIAGALAAAHDAGVIHRDLKPENIIVTTAGRAKVVDFGIARVEAPEGTRMTVPGRALGTPAYMAPEQLVGGVVTPRADIYAFGIVFSEMLTGVHPLMGTGATAPPPFAAVIAKCIRTNADERYASGGELRHALAADAAPQTPDAKGGAPVGSPRWWWEFHQAVTAAIYWVMTWPAWLGRQIVGGAAGRALFIAILIAVIVAANLRLYLWFTSRFYPAELRWTRRRVGRWIRAADWLFVVCLASTGILAGEDRSPVAVVLIAVASGAAIAFLFIERGTTRAAFRSSTTPRVTSS